MNVASKLDFVDQKPDDGVVHHLPFGEADRTLRQPLDPGPKIEVLSLNPLGVALADFVAGPV